MRRRKTRHQPHQPPIGPEMPVRMVAEVPLTGLSFRAMALAPTRGWRSTAATRWQRPSPRWPASRRRPAIAERRVHVLEPPGEGYHAAIFRSALLLALQVNRAA